MFCTPGEREWPERFDGALFEPVSQHQEREVG